MYKSIDGLELTLLDTGTPDKMVESIVIGPHGRTGIDEVINGRKIVISPASLLYHVKKSWKGYLLVM